MIITSKFLKIYSLRLKSIKIDIIKFKQLILVEKIDAIGKICIILWKKKSY